jgi:G3E family GTPase
MDQDIAERAKLDAVVTVADAKYLSERLKDAPEAKSQIAFADVVLLNKTDLVTKDELDEVEARIRSLNPYARVIKTERCQVPLNEVLDKGAFDLERILDIEPAFLDADEEDEHDHHDHDHHHDHHGHDDHGHDHDHGLKHYHDEDMQSVSFTIGEVDPQKFMPWVQNIAASEGQHFLRWKGIMAVKGEPRRFVLQGVHMIIEGDLQREWKPDEKRVSRLVFIGKDLPVDKLREGFEATAV